MAWLWPSLVCQCFQLYDWTKPSSMYSLPLSPSKLCALECWRRYWTTNIRSTTISLPTYLSIYLPVYLSIYVRLYLSFYVPICSSMCLSLYVPNYLFTCLCAYLSIHPSMCPSIHLFAYLSIHVPLYVSIYLCAYLFIYLSTFKPPRSVTDISSLQLTKIILR
jgi:hypothetical protein